MFSEDYQPQIGKGTVLREGSEVTIVATGVMVEHALRASEQLRAAGIAPRVLALHTIKPLDRALLLAAAAETGAVVTVEEHSIIGGLGSAVAELLAGEAPVPVVRVGLPDTFAETGPYEALLDRYGMSVEHIVSAAKRAIALRG